VTAPAPPDSSSVRAVRVVAEQQRATEWEDATGSQRVEPNGVILKTASTFWKLGACVAVIVAATVAATGWIEGRIKERIAPVEYRLERIEQKIDTILERLPR